MTIQNLVPRWLAMTLMISVSIAQARSGPVRKLDAVPKFTALESMSAYAVCGPTTAGKLECLNNSQDYRSASVPDTVGTLKSAFTNGTFACGFDEDGLKCWASRADLSPIDGVPYATAVRDLLLAADLSTIKLSGSNFCAREKVSKDWRCLLPFYQNNALRISEPLGVQAIAVADYTICWSEKTSAPTNPGKIHCERGDSGWSPPTDMALENVEEIVGGYSFLCARSKSEGKCWTLGGVSNISPELISAPTWVSDESRVCALTKDKRIVCIDPATGLPPTSTSSIGDVPVEYQKSNPDIQSFQTSGYNACVLHTSGKARCWDWYTSANVYVLGFSEKPKSLFGINYSQCAIMENGQAECRSTYGIDSRTLRKGDPIHMEFGLYDIYAWNSSGIDTRNASMSEAYRNVTTVSTGKSYGEYCAVGTRLEDASTWPTVRCYGYDIPEDSKSPPVELMNPFAVAIANRKMCALSDEGMTCWGEFYSGTAMPNQMSEPKKVLLGEEHACGIDKFGFVCWGRLDDFDLQIPSGLDQPGKVVDFALGYTSTCALLNDGTATCWGKNSDNIVQAPNLKNARSIVSSGENMCALDDTGVHCWGQSGGFPK